MSQLDEKKSDRKSGRAVFDEGRTVWEWQTATGVFERHVTEEQLARLEHAGLQLAEPGFEGRAIYGETGSQTAYNTRKQVFVGRPAPVRATATGSFRQFFRRWLPSS
ncbi:hypothetical protein [Peristeroidobacter soli]|jgi:hypothetical protein|uniref:hypothetical protein n=1 Tax=Peristeroidobacter soli TaxID=2497877 RepID=UPI00101DEB33|nr:hypothetical protein [Peristeroidobacter soli]